jgi:ribosomal-protein-alanine N-acetyltransferase
VESRCHGDQALIGFGGFWHFREPPELEILHGVAESGWNRNYATEIAQAVIEYGVHSLGMRTIRGSTDAANRASVRVFEKLGFRFERRASVGGLDTVFYVAHFAVT